MSWDSVSYPEADTRRLTGQITFLPMLQFNVTGSGYSKIIVRYRYKTRMTFQRTPLPPAEGLHANLKLNNKTETNRNSYMKQVSAQ